MTEMLLTGKYKELGVPTVPHVMVYLLLLVTAFGLISGNPDGVTLAKVVSVLLAGHGSLLFLNPRIDGELHSVYYGIAFDHIFLTLISLFISYRG